MTGNLVHPRYIPAQGSPLLLYGQGFLTEKGQTAPRRASQGQERARLATSLLPAQHKITAITQEHPRFALNEWGDRALITAAFI